MEKASKRAQDRALEMNVLAVKVADQIQEMEKALEKAYLANLDLRDSVVLALDVIQSAANWAQAFQALQVSKPLADEASAAPAARVRQEQTVREPDEAPERGEQAPAAARGAGLDHLG